MADAISKIDALFVKYGKENANKNAGLNAAIAKTANDNQMKGVVNDAAMLMDCLEYVFKAD